MYNNYPTQTPRSGSNSHVMVIIEKKPKDNAATAEKANANMFLCLSCRTTDTTANKATNKNKIASTIFIPPVHSLHSYLLLKELYSYYDITTQLIFLL